MLLWFVIEFLLANTFSKVHQGYYEIFEILVGFSVFVMAILVSFSCFFKAIGFLESNLNFS